MAILEIIVADLFVSQSLVSLGELNKALIQVFDSLVLGGVGSNFIGVVDEGEALVVSRDSFLVGALY